MPYVELHARSAFSFLRGAALPETLVERCAELEMAAIALCDRNGFYGSPRAHQAGLEHGVKAKVGCDLVMEDGSVLPLLVQSRQGYQNLCRLMTRMHLRSEKGEGRATWEELAMWSTGLVALSGDHEGPLLSAWRNRGAAGAAEVMASLQRIFGGDRLHIEIQRHLVRGENRERRFLLDLARHYDVPLVATNGAAYARPEGRGVMDVFTCLRHHTHLDAAGDVLAVNAECYLKRVHLMEALFADLPEAVANTERVAEQLEFSLADLGYEFPRYPVPEGESMDSFLKKVTWFGAQQRYGSVSPQVRRQLDHELALISKLGFPGYFLVVWDICNFCRENGILVQGRGSAANSAVCYSLGITAVDPIGQKLLFERFLSEGRKDWPDIDLDLPSGDRRERVIQEVYRRFGENGAAMTANVITYRGRSAVREIGKCLNLPNDIVDRFSSLFAEGDFPETLKLQEQLRIAGLPAEHPRAPALVSLFRQIHGLPRHLGQHSGGMIFCQGRLDRVMPLENASMPGRVVAQWDKTDCEELGIVKVDLLGLGMMSVLQDALEECEVRGRPVDLSRIPKDDAATFGLMQKADTIGVFQIESRAQMATLPRMKPMNFYDVAVEVAIIRPGPIHGNAVHPYLDRRAGKIPVTYLDERLRPILERTLGVCLFQEQILQIAMLLGGFSAAEADELRRAIGFTRSPKRLLAIQEKLRHSLACNGVAPAAIEDIIHSLASFALYGFPESHALSFALLAYASAYLKVHRAAEFYAGLLNNQPMGFYSESTLVQDARRHGIRVLPVCVQASTWAYRAVSDSEIRMGLRAVKGLREEACLRLLASRQARSFASVTDLLTRTRFTKAELRALAKVGALNVLASHRRAALWQVEQPTDAGTLFEGSNADAELSPLEVMTHFERMRADYTTLGLTVGSHPMAAIRARLPVEILTAVALKSRRDGELVTVAGSVICRQRPGTAKGFVFISLEDETFISNIVVEPKRFEALRLVITQEPSLVVRGRLQNREGVVHVRALEIWPLNVAEVPAEASHDFH